MKTILRRHGGVIVSVSALCGLVWFLPQVRNPIFQAPYNVRQWIGFVIIVGGYAGWVSLTLLYFVRPATFQSGWIARTSWLIHPTLGWLDALVTRLRPLSVGAIGYALPIGTAILAAWAAAAFPLHRWNWYPSSGAFIRIVAGLIALANVWLLFGRWFDPLQMTSDVPLSSTQSRRRRVWQKTGSAIAVIAVAMVIGEIIWIFAVHRWLNLSLRHYSVWAFLSIAAGVVLVAGLVDYLNLRTRWPWRWIALALSMMILSFGSSPELPEDQLPIQTADGNRVSTRSLDQRWWDHLDRRLTSIPDGPVILIAASGGGSRAALFTAMVLNELTQTSDPKPKSSPQSKQRDLADVVLSDRILMISGVSGGALAAARYVSLLDRQADPDSVTDRARGGGRSGGQDGVLSGAAGVLRERLRSYPKDDSLAKYTDPDEWLSRTERIVQQRRRGRPRHQTDRDATDSFSDLDAVLKQIGRHRSGDELQSGGPIAGVLGSQLVDEMGIDFMAAIYRGVLVPNQSRGEMLHDYWRRKFGWENGSQLSLPDSHDSHDSHLGNGNQRGKINPALLFGITDTDHGRRMMVGFPRLPADLLPVDDPIQRSASPAERSETMINDQPPSGVADRRAKYRPYSLSSLDPNANLSLTRAVRLSSSFPFGFRPTVYRTDSVVTHLLDGGIVDNTGIDNLHALLLAIDSDASSSDPPGLPASVLRRLKRRGVILLEIDSGARPRPPLGGGPLTLVTRPLASLGLASHTTALRSRDIYIREISRLLSTPERVRLATWRITCNPTDTAEDQVMTALALGPHDKARVLAEFLIQRLRWKTEIVNLFENLL